MVFEWFSTWPRPCHYLPFWMRLILALEGFGCLSVVVSHFKVQVRGSIMGESWYIYLYFTYIWLVFC